MPVTNNPCLRALFSVYAARRTQDARVIAIGEQGLDVGQGRCRLVVIQGVDALYDRSGA